MPHRGVKRPAATASSTLARESGASFSLQSRFFDESLYLASRDTQDIGKLETPYGPIRKHFNVASTDGGGIKIAYCCPFALFYTICSTCQHFIAFVTEFLVNGIGRVSFYIDETKPGNSLRPDVARAINSAFWGIVDLPDWFRGKRCWWFVFTHVPMLTMKRIAGGAATLYLKMLEIFWSDQGLNFLRLGILVSGRLIKFAYSCIVVDEKAEKETFGLKGAGGVHMCASCANCARTKKSTAGSTLIQYTEADMTKFERNSPELVNAAAEVLQERKPLLNKTAFQNLEKIVGLKYDMCKLLLSPYRSMVKWPLTRYTDWFHDLIASGGCFQYAVNGVVNDLVGLGVSLANLDEFNQHVRMQPARLGRSFFADRTVHGTGRHIRAFASETITAVQVLAFFFQCVFDNTAFEAQRRLTSTMRHILHILLSGDAAVAMVDTLDRLLLNFHILMMQLYPSSATPKLHLMRHIVDGLRYTRRNLSCASGERMHRRTHQFGNFAFRSFQDTILLRTIKALINDLQDVRQTSHTDYEGKQLTLWTCGARAQAWPSVRVGATRYQRNTVLHWTVDGERMFGLARGILKLQEKPFVSVFLLEASGCADTWARSATELVVDCRVIEGSASFFECDGTITTLRPI